MTALQLQIKIGQKKLLPTPPAFHLVLWLIKGGCCWGRKQHGHLQPGAPGWRETDQKEQKQKRASAHSSQVLGPPLGPGDPSCWIHLWLNGDLVPNTPAATPPGCTGCSQDEQHPASVGHVEGVRLFKTPQGQGDRTCPSCRHFLS